MRQDTFTLVETIKHAIRTDPDDIQAYRDLYSVLLDEEEEDFKYAHEENKALRGLIADGMALSQAPRELYDAYKKSLLFDAPYDFDAYMLYLESDRMPRERFYMPRRKILKKAVDAIQDLVDGELDELFLSMPPRVGKSTLMTFLFTWILGREPEKSNLYCAYSDTITSAFYSGVLEIMQDPYTYLWKDVFPSRKIVHTNSKEETINIDRNKKYPSLTARSLYGTLNGACDCSGYLVSDDLIGGIEEALNPARMIGAWTKVENNMLTRAKANSKLLWVGTRWSIIDPAGKRLNLLENDQRFEGRRYRVVTLPALDENGESNFDYDYGVGFTTEYFLQRRASFEHNGDMASWNAQYMQTPIERDGTVFQPDMMRYYNGSLPDGATSVVMSVDPAFGGGDYVAAPIAATYDDGDAYIIDTVFNNGDKRVTIPILVERVLRHGVRRVQFYSNKMTNSYREEFEKELRAAAPNARVLVTSKPDSNKGSKQQRIFDAAPDIRDRFVFLESKFRSKEYEMFMQNVYSFTFLGKNPHDDAPDSLTQLLDMVVNPMGAYRIFKRLF